MAKTEKKLSNTQRETLREMSRHYAEGRIQHIPGGFWTIPGMTRNGRGVPDWYVTIDLLVGWATHYIEKLLAGETVQFRPRGSSMQPKIKSGALCTVEPIDPAIALRVDDIVLCKVKGREYLHLIKAVDYGGLYQIGNNRGGINGWINARHIYGRCIKVEP